jgi:transcriptional regulator with XRE-family HTH domain
MSAAENISRNVRRLRRARGWKQAEVAEHMAALTGSPWSAATWGAAERASEAGRTKSWTANEIAALAELFDMPVGDLFEPQPPCRACNDQPPVGFTCNTCGAAAGTDGAS